MSSQPRGRDKTLDLIKAFAILGVVFYHNARLNPDSFLDNIAMLVPSAAVPLFFMVSGAVFFSSPFDLKRHMRRILNLYGTMVIWKLIYLVVYLPDFQWGDASRAVLSYLFLFQPMEQVTTEHFWFFQGMIAVLLAAPLFYYGCGGTGEAKLSSEELWDKACFRYALVVLIAFNQLLTSGNFLLGVCASVIQKEAWDIGALAEINPFSFRYSNFMVYYLLGALLYGQREKWKTRTAVLLAAAGMAGLMLIRFWQTKTFLWAGVRLESVYYWSSTMLLAAGLFLLAFRLPADKNGLLQWIARYVGTATLSVYCMHTLVIRYLAPVLLDRFDAWNGSLVNGLESLLVVGMILVIHWGFRGIKRHVKVRRTS
ncbi:MAG: acyltransferase [Lachnospiraceae bacterium]|nr:acyltransferase [Lachnospiraceae bacterium]